MAGDIAKGRRPGRRGARAALLAGLLAALAALPPAHAVEPAAPVAPLAPSVAPPPSRGPVTGRILPRYVSLKASRANVRRGPGLTHRVDWVFVRRGMPLQIIAEHGHWRRVRDVDGAMGWVHYSLLRGDRTAVVRAPEIALRAAPESNARVDARAEAGVILRLDECGADWCLARVDGARGWAPKGALWGVGPAESFD